MNSDKLIEWKKKVWLLHILDYKTEKYFLEGKISKKGYKTLKRVIDSSWLNIFDYHPDSNPQLSEAFHKNFGLTSQSGSRVSQIQEVKR